MPRQGLMDDSGYMGFEECTRYEECCEESFRQGYLDGEKAERERWIEILKKTFTNLSLIESIEKEVNRLK